MTCSAEGCQRPKHCRGLCKMHYERQRRYGRIDNASPVEQRLCSVMGCDKPARNKTAELCAMHYHREYRHRDRTKTAHGSGINKPTTKYRRIPCKGHPLASRNGDAWEHRVVLYDKIGPGPHACHHCGARIVWFVVDPRKNDPRLIYADHLDSDRGNNDPANLFESCYRCNQGRGQRRRSAALTDAGWWSGKDTRLAVAPVGVEPTRHKDTGF